MKLPKIKENLLVQEAGDEVLIYDQSNNKSYCLNETAKTVFNACDGQKTFADVKLPEDIVYLSLDELKKQNLIESDYASPFVGMNRREVIKKIGLASVIALPVISSLSVPAAAHAASACTPGTISDPSGTQGRGNTCTCGQNSTNNGGRRLCNTTRGGADGLPTNTCKNGCLCQADTSATCMELNTPGVCPGTCG